jgi:hypothetical protein
MNGINMHYEIVIPNEVNNLSNNRDPSFLRMTKALSYFWITNLPSPIKFPLLAKTL